MYNGTAPIRDGISMAWYKLYQLILMERYSTDESVMIATLPKIASTPGTVLLVFVLVLLLLLLSVENCANCAEVLCLKPAVALVV